MTILSLIVSGILVSGIPSGTPAARVNGEAVEAAKFREELHRRYAPVALQDLMDDRLLEQEARRLKLKVDERQIQRLTRDRLRQQAGDQTLDDPRLDPQSLLRWMRRAWIADEISKKLTIISDKEIRAFYESRRTFFVEPVRVRVRDLVVDTKDNADQIRAALNAGGHFAQLAKTFSTDSASRPEGGDLGALYLRSFALPLREAVGKMQVGEVSQPIQVGDEWHILKLESKQAERQKPLNEVRIEIRQRLYQEKLPMTRHRLLEALRARAHIDLGPPASGMLKNPSLAPVNPPH